MIISFVYNDGPMMLLLYLLLLLLLAINLLLFLRNTSHSLFRWVKVFVQYLVPKILLLCILLLLLGINLSFCSILKSLFDCLLIRYQIYQGFLLVAVLDPSFFSPPPRTQSRIQLFGGPMPRKVLRPLKQGKLSSGFKNE